MPLHLTNTYTCEFAIVLKMRGGNNETFEPMNLNTLP